MTPTPLVDLSDAALARVRLNDEIDRAGENVEALLFITHTALAARLADVAVTAADRVLAVTRKSGEREDLAVALLVAGSARGALGDHADAVRLLQEGRGLADERGDEITVALARIKLAYCLAQLREVERAREHLDAALPVFDAVHEPMITAEIENTRAAIATAMDDHVTAEAIKAKLAVLIPSGSDVDAARAKVRLAASVHNGGDRVRARAMLYEAISVLEHSGDKAGLAHALEGLGVIERQENRPEAAIALYERGVRLAREAGQNGRVARFVLLRGYCLVHLGRNRDGVDAFLQAAALFEKRGETYDEADAHWSLGLALRNLRENKAAAKHFAKAAELFWSMDMDGKAGECEKAIAELRKKR